MILASGALGWLEPFAQLAESFGAFSTALLIVVYGALALVLLAPSVAALAAARIDGWYIRAAPFVWLTPSLAAVASLRSSIPDSGAESWMWWLLPYLIWSVVAVGVATVHLVIRAGRLLVSDRIEVSNFEEAIASILYGWGAAAAGCSLVVAGFAGQSMWPGLFGVATAIVGVVYARSPMHPAIELTRTTFSKVRFVAGSLLIGFTSLPFTFFAVFIALDDKLSFGSNNGTIAMVLIGLALAVGMALYYRNFPTRQG